MTLLNIKKNIYFTLKKNRYMFPLAQPLWPQHISYKTKDFHYIQQCHILSMRNLKPHNNKNRPGIVIKRQIWCALIL